MEEREQEFLPFHRPWIGEEEIAEVCDTLRSGWLTLGPKTHRFEEKFAAYLGARHAVALSSCTAALHLALEALGIGPGDEVITTPYTFTATVAAILYTGARPVLADVMPDYPNIDPAQVADKITERTRAIIPVHFGGAPCDLDAIELLARRCGAAVVEDAAHALPARYRGRMIGARGKAVAFSFYAGKNITTGEGGMLVTDDERLAEQVRVLRLHGISRDAWKRYSKEGSWYYEVTARGFKYNMTDINAAIGLHQLDRLADFDRRRRRLVARYNERLAPVRGIRLPAPPAYGESAWHLYVVEIEPEEASVSRAEVIEGLRRRGIGTSVHFIPIHLHPYYQRVLGCQAGDFPNATRHYEGAISLPLFPAMTEGDVDRVAEALIAIMGGKS
ncbi:MAG: DegT/DnrJ/EryC1/StrS aminotransferase family protein [Candidatus Dadabacteria bacterium]|nr:MAG: DegT/DnrJ/EryC1/StrS aminotransferase family protein [Candidatus Dadabacteria bacterium]